MLQLLGGEPPPPGGGGGPIYTVVPKDAPTPGIFEGVTVYCVVTPGATVRAGPSTPMFQLYVIGVSPVVHDAVRLTCVPAVRPVLNVDPGTAVTEQFDGTLETGGADPLQTNELSTLLNISDCPLGQSGTVILICSACADGKRDTASVKPNALTTRSKVLFRMFDDSLKMPMVYNDCRSIPLFDAMCEF